MLLSGYALVKSANSELLTSAKTPPRFIGFSRSRVVVQNRLLTLLRGNEDVKDIVAMQFSIGAVRKVFATIAALNFDVKWEHVFV